MANEPLAKVYEFEQSPYSRLLDLIPERFISECDPFDGVIVRYENRVGESLDKFISYWVEGDRKKRIDVFYNGISIFSEYTDQYHIKGIYTSKTFSVYIDGVLLNDEDIHQVDGDLGYITYYMSDSNSCKGSDYCIRLMRRGSGRVIGEFYFENGYCVISNLDCNVAYDAILFDRSNKYESISMSNRTPSPIE